MELEQINVGELIPYARNARLHDDAQIAAIAGSITEFGFTNPVLVDGAGVIIAGHGRVLAAQRLGLSVVPCVRLAHLTEAQVKAYRIADNRLAEIGGGWDDELLKIEIDELAERLNFDVSVLGFTAAELGELGNAAQDFERIGNGGVSERFIYPPFSVLGARAGWWQERKNRWIDMGIESSDGRADDLLFKSGLIKQAVKVHSESNARNGTSIFDPVLCELLYRWFAPQGGTVLDPFCGGSVRGIIAATLGLSYLGFDIRAEQVNANRAQWERFAASDAPVPRWEHSDCRDFLPSESERFDFLFSCPPYGDLEKYSDEEGDISNMPHETFLTHYREIIATAAGKLADDRFACFVVGEIREKTPSGYYRNFIPDTIAAFEAAGLRFYNEAILITMIGSLSLRITHQFSASRKMGKTHQNVLIFCKGDPRKAAAACGEVEVATVFPTINDDATEAKQ